MKTASSKNWNKMDVAQLLNELEDKVKWRGIPHDTLNFHYYEWAIPKLKEMIIKRCNSS